MRIRSFAALALLVFASCQVITGPDLLKTATQDVKVARASEYKMTITSVASGTTSPSGVMTVKDGIALDIEGTAQPESVLIGWRQTGGSGKATFKALSTTVVSVTVEGGNVTVEPVYEDRPVVLYMTPIGNNIAKNSSVKLVFNREVDLGSVAMSPLVTIKKQGTIEVPYAIVAKPGVSSVTLKPQVLSLDDYSQYVVSVGSGVPVKAVFDATAYPGVTFLNTAVTMRTNYTSPFQTGAAFDSLPPYGGSFKIASPKGNDFYTSNEQVVLHTIEAFDDSGDGGVDSLSVRNGSDPFPDFPIAYGTDLTLDWSLPSAADGEYSVSMIFKDINGNALPVSSAISRTFWVDAVAPTISSFTLDSSVAAPGYTTSPTATFHLTAADPDISGTSVPGSGESPDGATALDQKQYRLSNNGITWSAWAPFTATSTWSVTAGDGQKTVSVQVKDAVGNKTGATAQVTLDTTAPSASASLVGGTLFTSSTSIHLVTTASDSGSGLDTIAITSGSPGLASGSAYLPTRSGVAGSAGTLTGTGLPAIPFADDLALVLDGGVDGHKYLNVTVKDKLLQATPLALDVVLDRAAPTKGAVTFATANTSQTTVTLQFNATDATSGVTQVGYVVKNTTGVPAGAAGATWVPYQASLPVTFSPSSNLETEYAFIWFKDAAGNMTADPGSYDASISYSNVAPTGSLTLVTASPVKNGPVTVNWTANSYGTSVFIAKVELSNDNATWVNQSITPNQASLSASGASWNVVNQGGGNQTNGNRTIYLRITDTNSPAKVTTKSVSYVFDNTAPTVTGLTLTGTGGSGSTNSTGITVAFTTTDNLTPAGSVQYQISDGTNTTSFTTAATSSVSTAFTLSAAVNVTKTVTVVARDLAGNVTGTPASATIIYETTVPTISTRLINAGATYTNSASVTLSLTASDAGSNPNSGVAWMRFSNDGTNFSPWVAYASTYSGWDLTNATYGGNTTNGTKTVRFQVKDTAGNVSTTTYPTDSIYFDNTAPTPNTLSGVPANATDRVVTMTNTATDGGSGLAFMEYWVEGTYSGWITYNTTLTVLLTPINALKHIQVRYQDAAGNVSGWTPYGAAASVLLGAGYSNFYNTNWHNIVGANYADPADRAAVQSTTYISTTSALNLTTGFQGPRAYVFTLASGKFGWIDYYISGTTVQFYYQTFNSSGTPLQSNWTYSSVPLPTSGNWSYFDLDSTSGALGTTWTSAVDMYLYNVGGVLYMYPYNATTMAWALF